VLDVSTDQAAYGDEAAAVPAAIGHGDDVAFGALVERHRRELHVHCYRMLGSYEDAEDLVQETFLRAWRSRDTFAGRSSFRAWLYRIATNACLDAIERRPRLAPLRAAVGAEAATPADLPWLQPYPDHLLEAIAPSAEEPDVVVVAKETIELAYVVAIQHLPPRQRAVLILRDVLGWSAKDAASLLETTVASSNSALQRARAMLKQHLPEHRTEWTPGYPSRDERELLHRYMDATHRGDVDALMAVLRQDLRFSMPPEPETYVGREEVVAGWIEGGFGSPTFGAMRCSLTRANMQPAVACYLRRPGDAQFRAFALDVLRIEDGLIAEVITFDASLFPAFRLPPTLGD
jgi:RNA polymerase sigma-70 factor (ECF subfamily)